MKVHIRISIYLLFIAVLLSENAAAKTVYFNMSQHQMNSRCCGYDMPICPGTVLCLPYPINGYYGTLSTTVVPPVNTNSKIEPTSNNVYCTYFPNRDPITWGYGNYCKTTPPSTTTEYGEGFATNETGTIPAGTWRFGVNTTSTAPTGNARMLIYVWKFCAMNVGPNGTLSETLLFRINGSQNHMPSGQHLETISTTQPSFSFASGKNGEFCYLVVSYTLNVTTGSGSDSYKSTLVGGVRGSNITYPTPLNFIYGVNINSPQTDLLLGSGQTFLMNCTPSTDDSVYGINMSFEFNYSGQSSFIGIPVNGTRLSANASTEQGARNDTQYSRLITAVSGNDYYVRCRLYNSTNSMYTPARKVVVRDPANLKIAEFRIYLGSDMSAFISGQLTCLLTSSFGSGITNSSTCQNNLPSNTQYKALILICNDGGQFANSSNISAVVHGKLNSTYIGTMGMCIAGNATPTQISCDWNSNVTNGVYMNASTMPAIPPGATRSMSSCQWYAYNFTTGPTRSTVSIYSNLSTQGATSGINPVLGNLTINVSSQSDMNYVSLDAPKYDLKQMDGSNFSMNCTPSTRGGYYINVTFEYNSTNQSWGGIPTSGGAFTIGVNNTEVEVKNNVTYNRTVFANNLGSYWVRCRMYNTTNSTYSNVTRVDVYPGLLNITISYPPPDVYNASNPLVVRQYDTLGVNASIRCSSLGVGAECGNVTCSIRYNKSSLLPDSLISEVQGATPFYVVSANMTHDFRGVSSPSTTHKAVQGGVLGIVAPNQISTAGEATSGQYSKISYEDGNAWDFSFYFPAWDQNISFYNQFRFQVNESVDSIRKIKYYYKGWSVTNKTAACDIASYLTTFYVWNFTSSTWKYLGNHSSPFNDVISGELTSGFADLVDSSYLYLLASTDLGYGKCRTNISTDFVKIDVELSNRTILPCGRMMYNQTCDFSWLLNATGVNELRVIDVNCSSTKSTVNQSNSGDLYTSFKGVEVHTDKNSYGSCGNVYYKVRVYNSENNPVDDNLTMKVYDPSGNLVNQSRASTTGGVFYGIYALPAGSQIGEWVMKATSCFVSSKTFGVGLGNASGFWKIDLTMPDRARFLKSERINFTFRLYNQLGEGVWGMGPYISIDENLISGCSRGNIGEYACSVVAPSSAGTHILNVTVVSMGRMVTEIRYFYVGD